MASKHPVTAIFDIGKTNKKFLLFDRDYHIVLERKTRFDETKDDDGYPCDDLKQISEWALEEFGKAVESSKYRITELNVSAYGASLVHLGETGQPVTPLYNYLKPYPDDLAEQFYSNAGGKQTFSLETASPPMGMLNSGLQLFWLKQKKPHLFNRIETSLHLPQYIAYLFSKFEASELTSIGCHTGMWNFRENNYHTWLQKEGLLQLLAPIKPVQTIKRVSFQNHTLKAGIGIHDSSAALAPYLTVFKKPFIQLSTGTWSIAMNPFSADPLTFEELRRDCLQYINIHGKPVKASRFLLGGEYSHQIKKAGLLFGKNPESFDCKPDPVLIEQLANQPDQKKKLTLEKAYGSGPWQTDEPGDWEPGKFERYDDAVHQCMLDLVSIQADALKLAEGSRSVPQVIITGGFAKNLFFCRLLASFFPGKEIFTASASSASALGAAVVLQLDNLPAEAIRKQLRLNKIEPYPGLNIGHYSRASAGFL